MTLINKTVFVCGFVYYATANLRFLCDAVTLYLIFLDVCYLLRSSTCSYLSEQQLIIQFVQIHASMLTGVLSFSVCLKSILKN